MGQKLSYDDWLKTYNVQEAPDYNTHDAWLSGVTPDKRGHLPDTYKLPNHITYSDESVYSKQKDAPEPGKWRQDSSGKWQFWASDTNVNNAGGVAKLQDYFNTVEPDSTLFLPSYSALDKLFQRKN